MSNPILDAAIEYSEQGYSIIPVDRGTKKPCVPWKEYQSRIATEEEIEAWWEQYPTANVAIITGETSGLAVVDADSEAGIEWMTKHCTKTTVYAKTGKGKHAYYTYPYHTAIKNAVRIAPDVDVRGEGGYVVAPPSIHSSGKPYEWEFVGGGWDDLPEFKPVNGFRTLFTDEEQPKGGNLNVNLSGVKTAPVNTGVEKGSRNNTLAQLAGRWSKAGLEFDEIELLAKKWNSSNTPPLGESEIKATLKSIWKRHVENDAPVIDVPEETPHLIPSFSALEDKQFPEALLHPGGLLEELMDFIGNNSAASKPIFSLAAALSFIGAVAGQKVMTQTGLRTNLYCISSGYSGSGKNGALSTLPQLLRRTHAMSIQGPTELTSEAALLSWLSQENKRNCWLCLDEIGQVLKGMKNPASPQAGIPRQLTALFSATDRPLSKGYAIAGNNIVVPWHHTSLYGATTPDRLWESLQGGEVADGFMARILMFKDLSDPERPNYNNSFKISESLVEKINAVFDIDIEQDKSSGNLSNFWVPIPKEIPLTEEAYQVFEVFAEYYHQLRNKHKTDEFGKASIYGRAAEHALKVALIHSVSTYLADVKVIDVNSIRFACELVHYLVTILIDDISKNITETDVSSWKMKILRAIKDIMVKNRSAGKDHIGATLRDLQRGRCQGLKSKELQELLNDLVIAEKIGKNSIVISGKTIARYFLV